MLTKILYEIKNNINNFAENTFINIRLILNDRKFLIFALFLLILFSYLAYFVYTNYITKNLNNNHVLNKELINTNSDNLESNNGVLIVFFKTDWCPYCKTSQVEWNKFKESIETINKQNKKKIKLLTIDCDEKPDIADKYKIEAYPTIKMFYKGEIYDYDAKPNNTHLLQFVESFVDLQ